MVRDPVCRMEVDPLRASDSVDGAQLGREGLTYYFCSQMCRTLFLQDPARYLQAGGGVPMGDVDRRTARIWVLAIGGVLLALLLMVFLVSLTR